MMNGEQGMSNVEGLRVKPFQQTSQCRRNSSGERLRFDPGQELVPGHVAAKDGFRAQQFRRRVQPFLYA
jgi:hypothetical protein